MWNEEVYNSNYFISFKSFLINYLKETLNMLLDIFFVKLFCWVFDEFFSMRGGLFFCAFLSGKNKTKQKKYKEALRWRVWVLDDFYRLFNLYHKLSGRD